MKTPFIPKLILLFILFFPFFLIIHVQKKHALPPPKNGHHRHAFSAFYSFFLLECSFSSSRASLNFSELMVGLERSMSRWKKSLKLLTFSLSATLLVYFCRNSATSFFTLSKY